eukprot:1181469-Prorocentrum_minimum.AAC.1
MGKRRVAIVGAGMFESGNGVGGRMSTRRYDLEVSAIDNTRSYTPRMLCRQCGRCSWVRANKGGLRAIVFYASQVERWRFLAPPTACCQSTT